MLCSIEDIQELHETNKRYLSWEDIIQNVNIKDVSMKNNIWNGSSELLLADEQYGSRNVGVHVILWCLEGIRIHQTLEDGQIVDGIHSTYILIKHDFVNVDLTDKTFIFVDVSRGEQLKWIVDFLLIYNEMWVFTSGFCFLEWNISEACTWVWASFWI